MFAVGRVVIYEIPSESGPYEIRSLFFSMIFYYRSSDEWFFFVWNSRAQAVARVSYTCVRFLRRTSLRSRGRECICGELGVFSRTKQQDGTLDSRHSHNSQGFNNRTMF